MKLDFIRSFRLRACTISSLISYLLRIQSSSTLSRIFKDLGIVGLICLITFAGMRSADANLSGVTAISAGYHYTLALKSDGTVVGWGDNSSGTTDVSGLSGVKAIAAGYEHALALLNDGSVVAWGWNSYGQTNVPDLTSVIAIGAGYGHSVALQSNGTVVAWGYNGNGQTNVPTGLTGVTAISVGYNHTLALKSDGTVVAWGAGQAGGTGADDMGQSIVPTGLSGVKAIAAGYRFSAAVKSDGTVVVWGDDTDGEISNMPDGLSSVNAIAAGYHHIVAIKTDKTVVAWGAGGIGQTSRQFDYEQSMVPALDASGVTAVTAGQVNTEVLKSDGTVVGFGGNSDGQVSPDLPVLTKDSIVSNNTNTTIAVPGNTVTLNITASGIISAPTATIGGDGFNIPGNAATVSGSGTSWTASYVMTPSDIQGTVYFIISYSDSYGNKGVLENPTLDGSTVTFSLASPTTTTLSSSSLTPIFGASVTFTAVVSGTTGTPTGSVTFMDGITTLGLGPLNGSGTAAFATSSLGIGSHSITATYTGDATDSASTSNTVSVTVNKASTSTALTVTPNPSVYGGSVTFTATVTSSTAGTPTGSVTFLDGSTVLGTGPVSGGMATYATTTLGLGSHSITAVYGGDTSFSTSTSPAVTQTVNQASTSTALTVTPNPSVYGGSVTFTATVTSSGGAPTGSVTFKDGSTVLGTGTVSGGTATYATTSLNAGTHSITAAYGGDTNFVASTSPVTTQTVNQAPTTMSIGAPAVTYNANGVVTVAVSSSGSPAVTGSVSLIVDSGAATTLTLSNGSASFTITSPGVSSHSLSASYAAQGNFAASSITGTLTVNPAPTTTTISAPTIAYGANGSVTVKVSSGTLSPTGNVYLYVDGATTPMPGSITGTGQYTFTITNPSLGTHSLSASYLADGNFAASSATGQLTVGGSATTTTITQPATATYGAQASVTVTVSSGSGTPTGSVSLSLDGTPLTGPGLVNGSTTFTFNSPGAGSHVLSASYSAQGNFAASSGTGNLIVNQAVLTVTANNASKTYNTANPVFTASYTGFVNGDPQTVLTGTPSLSTTATTASSVGTYPINAVVGSLSSTNYSFKFVNGTLTVTPASTTTSVISSANPSILGASVTFTATVASGTSGIPTGSVTFKEGTTTLGTGTLNGSGIATYSTSALGLGSHSITAVYGGDANFASSTTLSGVNEAVNQIPTSALVTANSNPSIFGGSVTFTATVTSSGGTPTGSVTFNDGASALGTVTLSGGKAAYTTSALVGGAHSITVAYSGDTNFATTTSPAITQTVNTTSSSTTIASTFDPLAYGESVTFTATVTPSASTGTVTFMDGATTLGTGTLSSGTATYGTSALSVGPHNITAQYGGNTNFAPSSSAALPVTVLIADGKLDGSGTQVDVTDALMALRIAAGIDTPTASDLAHGDVAPLIDGQRQPDGKIDIDDVVAILRKAAGLPSW